MHFSPYLAVWWRFPDVLNCRYEKADFLDVQYIFYVRIYASYEDGALYMYMYDK